jgi:hypothetical protein
MDAVRRRSPLPRRLGSLVLGAVLAIGLLGAPVSAAERHRVEVGERADFVAQTNFVQCVGASLQMMINMIEPGRDRTAKEQRRLQELARSYSGSRPDGRQRQGASVRGWVRVLLGEVEQPYRLVGLDTLEEAVALAARAMDETGAPVGLLVWRGRHAWVMGGYESTKPLSEGGRVTKAVVYDPLHPYGSSVWGPSPKPGQAISLEALGRQFVPRRQSARFGALSGKYVLVLPYERTRSLARRPGEHEPSVPASVLLQEGARFISPRVMPW